MNTFKKLYNQIINEVKVSEEDDGMEDKDYGVTNKASEFKKIRRSGGFKGKSKSNKIPRQKDTSVEESYSQDDEEDKEEEKAYGATNKASEFKKIKRQPHQFTPKKKSKRVKTEKELTEGYENFKNLYRVIISAKK